jgi:drug/metabolite transporter (DMT)-like permease
VTPADIRLTGELAALGTSVLWSFTAIFFSRAGLLVGAGNVNRSRLLFAVILLTTTHRVLLGAWLPLDAEPSRWAWLAMSGVIGLALGDLALFHAFVIIGPRLAMLMMALAPVMTTIAGWVIFGETLTGLELTGVALALVGVAWVVTERRGNAPDPDAPPDRFAWGLLLGFLAATGQAAGVLAARMGLVGDFPTASATLIRTLAAALVIWAVAALRGTAVGTTRAWQNREALRLLCMGAVVGPFLGVWLSLVAVQRAPVGVASTLMALPPVFLIGLEYALFGTRVTRRAIVGTLTAIAGVAAIFSA